MNDDDGMIELVLDPAINKTGDTWHICIEVVSYSEELLQTVHFLNYRFVFLLTVEIFYIVIGFASRKCSLWLPC